MVGIPSPALADAVLQAKRPGMRSHARVQTVGVRVILLVESLLTSYFLFVIVVHWHIHTCLSVIDNDSCNSVGHRLCHNPLTPGGVRAMLLIMTKTQSQYHTQSMKIYHLNALSSIACQ